MRLGTEVRAFRDSRQTLQLATVSADHIPHVSYAPFAFDEQGYYILISDLAIHGRNLKQCRSISIMMVEDESEASNVHARKRLTFDAFAVHLQKQSPEGRQGLAALNARFGEFTQSLSQMGDFNLYRLTPETGRYVKGFGQAFLVSGRELFRFTHLNKSALSGANGHVADSSGIK